MTHWISHWQLSPRKTPKLYLNAEETLRGNPLHKKRKGAGGGWLEVSSGKRFNSMFLLESINPSRRDAKPNL